MRKVNVLIWRGKTKRGGRGVGCVWLADQGALIRHGCDQTCAGTVGGQTTLLHLSLFRAAAVPSRALILPKIHR